MHIYSVCIDGLFAYSAYSQSNDWRFIDCLHILTDNSRSLQVLSASLIVSRVHTGRIVRHAQVLDVLGVAQALCRAPDLAACLVARLVEVAAARVVLQVDARRALVGAVLVAVAFVAFLVRSDAPPRGPAN